MLYRKFKYKLILIVFRKFPEFFSKNFKVLYSKYIYHVFTNNYLDLKNPKNISEKIMWLKLYYTNPLIPKYSDKYSVREYLQDLGLSSLLNDLLGVYNSIDEIDFDELPNRFALKATHGCGYNIICNDKSKLNIEDSKNKLKHWLNSVYGLRYGEWHYSQIVPRVICEKYLDHPDNSTSIIDYKILCMNGRPFCFVVYKNRKGHNKMRTSYDLNWIRINILKEESDDIEMPKNLALMVQVAELLAKPFPFVRVDLYEIEGQLYFGELTFTPNGGILTIFTDEASNLLGEQLVLPKKNNRIIPFLS